MVIAWKIIRGSIPRRPTPHTDGADLLDPGADPTNKAVVHHLASPQPLHTVVVVAVHDRNIDDTEREDDQRKRGHPPQPALEHGWEPHVPGSGMKDPTSQHQKPLGNDGFVRGQLLSPLGRSVT